MTKALKLWSDIIKNKDNYTCQHCGTTLGKLCSHHIMWREHYPLYLLDIDNGITLCQPCHNKVHKLGFKYSTLSRKKMSLSAKNKVFTLLHRANLSKATSGLSNPFYGKHHTLKTCELISGNMLGNNNAIGNKSQTGKVWINNKVTRKMVFINLLELYINAGWLRGKKL